MDMCDISGAAVPCGMFFAEHGILKLTVPKKEVLPKTAEKRYISIDG